jgi:hypothetical protein
VTQPVSVIRTPSVWPFIGTPWSSNTSSGGTSGIVVVLDVVVEVVLDVVVVAGGAVVVVVDGDTVSVVGIVTSVGAKSAEDDPHAAARRLLSTATQATVRIRDRLAFGPGWAVDHQPAAPRLEPLGVPEILEKRCLSTRALRADYEPDSTKGSASPAPLTEPLSACADPTTQTMSRSSFADQLSRVG